MYPERYPLNYVHWFINSEVVWRKWKQGVFGAFTMEQLQMELAYDVHWFNGIRLNGTPGYRAPVEFRNTCFLQINQ